MQTRWRQLGQDLVLWVLLGVVAYFAVTRLFFLLFPVGAALVFSTVIRKSFRRIRPLNEIAKRILIILILLIFFALLSLIVILGVDLPLCACGAAFGYCATPLVQPDHGAFQPQPL
ncbi:MAG: hypothetical protein IKC69_03685, partial [Clostridia bacterium]|nr:hypothetical protein [Clostridia bacterium]